MRTLLKYTILLIFTLPVAVQAQSKKEVIANQIKYYVEKEIDYENGLNKERIIKESWYNKEGQLIEFKDWDKDGDPKIWEKYKYNADNTLKEKEEFNKKGEFKGKVIYHYENGILLKKSYFDRKLRLKKEKVYEFETYQ